MFSLQELSQHFTGCSTGHITDVGQSFISLLQEPSKSQRTSPLAPQVFDLSDAIDFSHSEKLSAQIPLKQSTLPIGHVFAVAQRNFEDLQVPSAQRIILEPLHLVFSAGFSHSSAVILHELSLQRIGESLGHLISEGQSSKFLRQSPFGQRSGINFGHVMYLGQLLKISTQELSWHFTNAFEGQLDIEGHNLVSSTHWLFQQVYFLHFFTSRFVSVFAHVNWFTFFRSFPQFIGVGHWE